MIKHTKLINEHIRLNLCALRDNILDLKSVNIVILTKNYLIFCTTADIIISIINF